MPQNDDRGVQPQFSNQTREPAQFHDTRDRIGVGVGVGVGAGVDNLRYPTNDSRRHGRIHETG